MKELNFTKKGENDVYVLKVQCLIDGLIDRLGAQRPSSCSRAAAARPCVGRTTGAASCCRAVGGLVQQEQR